MATFLHRRPRINPFGAGRSTNTLGKPSTEVFGLTAIANQENPIGSVIEPLDGVNASVTAIFPYPENLIVMLYPFGVNGPTPVDLFA